MTRPGFRIATLGTALLLVCQGVGAQDTIAPAWGRPVPPPLPQPAWRAAAIARGTRTLTGEPGAQYWQPQVRYDIEASLDTASHRLDAIARARWVNTGPDTLGSFYLQLSQNLFAPNALRNTPVPVTGGVEIASVELDGKPIGTLTSAEQEGAYQLFSTAMRIAPFRAIAPGDTVTVVVRYGFSIPVGAPRSGRSRDGLEYVVAYWYPQVAVLDDLQRWNAELYLGTAEFYQGFGDYDVQLTVPEGWLIAGTGQLVDETVLGDSVRLRLAQVRRTGAPQVIASPAAGVPPGQGMVTWRFEARHVRDFAWATSPMWQWEATTVLQHDRNGSGPDTVLVSAFFRPTASHWGTALAWTARALVEMAALTDRRYAYPQFSTIQGPGSCAGIEYPMATCIDQQRDSLALRSVIVHEVAHSWTPMRVASNENKYPWMDEGLTRFAQNVILERATGEARWRIDREQYLAAVRDGSEIESMRPGDEFPILTAAYAIAGYAKPSLALRALRGWLGEVTFWKAYRSYFASWDGKHPSPWDFFDTFNTVAAQRLDWFWRTWFFETWPLDQAIASVHEQGSDLVVIIEDRGWAPMPVLLTITRANGMVEERSLAPDAWLAGERQHSIRVPDGATVTRVELDPEEWYPDVDRTNQAWIRSGVAGSP